MKKVLITLLQWVYKHILTTFLFLFDSETIHTFMLDLAGIVSKVPIIGRVLEYCFRVESPLLESTVKGVSFSNPVGLAAGFDYRAQMVRLLPSFGFGFGTVGTLTHVPYTGNTRPRLGRLVRSKSLLVNKGFKNDGVITTLGTLGREPFRSAVGVSIGRTNTVDHHTHSDAIQDIVAGFEDAEKSAVPFHYYELNISCPNLASSIDFYTPETLGVLLEAVLSLNLSRPIFVKMPITLSDIETTALVDVIEQHKLAGIIIGNLQRDRTHHAFDTDEIGKAGKGNFSGAPCRDRSDALIKKIYQYTDGRLVIIGCGGIFTAEDAYRKIRNGAQLVQLVSGLVFEGPLLPARINAGLIDLLKQDGFDHVSAAVGIDAR